jgi:hypothetical protein
MQMCVGANSEASYRHVDLFDLKLRRSSVNKVSLSLHPLHDFMQVVWSCCCGRYACDMLHDVYLV